MLERLEALHMIIIETEAYQHACEETFHRLSWERGVDKSCRRDLNRIDCYFGQTSETISKLLAESDAALRAVMKSANRLARRRSR